MTQIIDRRPSGRNKSAVNRERFIRRFKKQIKKAVSEAISGREIRNIEAGERISIPQKDIREPHFEHGKGGVREGVHPGNIDFNRGDHIKRPEGAGKGDPSQASNEGEGEDPFVFELSREEFLDLFFEELALPSLVKKKLNQVDAYKWVRAGHSPTGMPTNINVVRSLTKAIGRRTALTSPYKREIEALEKKYEKLNPKSENDRERKKIQDEIQKLKNKIKKVPFIDPFDLRFHNRIKQPTPSTQAVMFCIMDVSGSMDEAKKDIAKRFFILLYLFLTRAYKKIDIIFVRHHTTAKEVDEKTFFYSRETGGTVVSSALEMVSKIIKERYSPNDWNIYCAQASDGDNWMNDSPYCRDILVNEIMPFVQYFAYVEILPRQHQSLWEVYTQVSARYPYFAMETIQDQKELYSVFRDLFKKEVHA